MTHSDRASDLENNIEEDLGTPSEVLSYKSEPRQSEFVSERCEVDVDDLPPPPPPSNLDPRRTLVGVRVLEEVSTPTPMAIDTHNSGSNNLLPNPTITSGTSPMRRGQRRGRTQSRPVAKADDVEVVGVEEQLTDDKFPLTHIAEEPIEKNNDDTKAGKERQRLLRKSRLSDLGFHDRLAATGIRHLYARSPLTQKPLSYNIELSTLQRMVIHELQRKLVFLVKGIVRQQEVPDATLEKAHSLLAQYTTAIRDYDFMAEKLRLAAESNERDPFTITTEDALSLYLMREALLVPNRQPVDAQDRARYTERKNILPGASRSTRNENANLARLWERIWMGVSGGLALIAPMLLMVLHKDEVTALTTASVATMLFALGLAILGKELKGQEVLASVAAYAAVLVVFVGVSS
ncbi:hypothetical protein AJ79_06743 [Helicocarpus griseus UAMH5409]|uniref:DUF6594 domain-containing protein n=1 Tax=Helicocarpus griseus UAMH5409 TaxID=1447875 RepID=A0A2B7X9F9_9EURO|nr:hypothetical protein AJ79_06743 [Helicocarpus griseus UAMH5409]